MTVRVVVVDDNQLLRAGLLTVLASDPEISVVAEAGSGPAGVREALAQQPDLVLMDVEMPGGDGITATRQILEAAPHIRVLILTMFDLDDYVVGALRAGASGFLLKTSDPQALISAVKESAAANTTLGPTVLARLVDTYVAQNAPTPTVLGLADLTSRELEVLRSMARGLSNAEIATELCLAETTVKTHVARVLNKLGVRDRVQAVVLAHQAGVAIP